MDKQEFRWDFGDLKVYEKLNSDSEWLKEIKR